MIPPSGIDSTNRINHDTTSNTNMETGDGDKMGDRDEKGRDNIIK